MRAKQFPRFLFETIHEAVGSPAIEKFPGYYSWDYFGICEGETEPFGHVGWTENETGNGIVSRVGVWGYTMRDPMTNKDTIKIVDPLLEIRGGPARVGVWAAGLGDLLKEEIIVSAGGNFSYRGENLKSPVIKLMSEVLGLAYHLAHETNLPPLSYWEKFKHPERGFRKP